MPTINADEPAWAKDYPPATGPKPLTILESLAKGFDDGAEFYLQDDCPFAVPNVRAPRLRADLKRDQNHTVAVPYLGVCAARHCQALTDLLRRLESLAACLSEAGSAPTAVARFTIQPVNSLSGIGLETICP